ncbi:MULTISPECIES: NUDIX hydrolase N-terminal domain-containing protein [Pseudomonas aeruginosa group]|uniref:NUDIX hydrolase N-terminal domain-containing protein n=1 Tax=Pseudomonas aeruginosa group TaxID=136841 RepID=UPI0005BB543B|nr:MULTISPECIES: NUDIX hydrolase N-terminal domain-containing protein [Pseudomonas aeruginosa group]MDK2351285.1 NUDIX hydrolase N-terminal domain-containing protein [Pseudomonas paraeruginosa]MEA8480806.1 NUDIX hydrolase N-terminal domain-containing protein [Pseudomonas aeruginosa]HBP5568494.1 NUDIX domain-containing protein [Pseudomonas aeruginosa]
MASKSLTQLLELTLATAQAGLTYSRDPFDIERFHALRGAVAAFVAEREGVAEERVQGWIELDSHYPTPKLDVRALILDGQRRVLLVREASDGCWTLPGGWCDINESPGTAVVREVYEETGLRVRARQLLALWDKQRHPHPPQLPHALKAFFLCVIVGGELRQRTDETLAAGYHEVAALPPLSRHRVLESQIRSLLARVEAGAQETLFD